MRFNNECSNNDNWERQTHLTFLLIEYPVRHNKQINTSRGEGHKLYLFKSSIRSHQLIKHTAFSPLRSIQRKDFVNWINLGERFFFLFFVHPFTSFWSTMYTRIKLNLVERHQRMLEEERERVVLKDRKHLMEFPFSSNLILSFAISMFSLLLLGIVYQRALFSSDETKNNIWAWKLNGIKIYIFSFCLRCLSVERRGKLSVEMQVREKNFTTVFRNFSSLMSFCFVGFTEWN